MLDYNDLHHFLTFKILLQAKQSSEEEDMKKTSALKAVGGDVGKLVFHTQPNFQGEQHEFKDSVAKINEGPWKGKPVQSLKIRGNPWLLYPEESCKVLKK